MVISKFFPQLDLKVIFQNKFSVGSFFRFKDRVPQLVKSNVVYFYKCGQCEATYCGETIRHLHTRIAEHKGVSPRTGRPIASPTNSSIRQHSELNDHPIVQTNFKILATSNRFDIKTVESIFIHKLKPTLNDSNASTPLHILA